ILAMHPEWDTRARRLKLPAMTRDSTSLGERIDHIMPPSWRGDTGVEHVSLLGCWNRGRRMIEDEWPSLKTYFQALSSAHGITILSPLGELLVTKPLDPDDTEGDLDEPAPRGSEALPTELEDAAAEESLINSATSSFSSVIAVHNSDQPMKKVKVLSLMQKPRYTAGSTDRLKRVADITRYTTQTAEVMGPTDDDSPYILVTEPAATLVRCEGKLFVAVGDVTGIHID
ncbi:hypothetical protein GGX14DRAFT_323364, partial [Mycena pura]